MKITLFMLLLFMAGLVTAYAPYGYVDSSAPHFVTWGSAAGWSAPMHTWPSFGPGPVGYGQPVHGNVPRYAPPMHGRYAQGTGYRVDSYNEGGPFGATVASIWQSAQLPPVPANLPKARPY